MAGEHEDQLHVLSAFRILFAWRSLEARRVATDLVRDPVALMAVASFLVSITAAFRSSFEREPSSLWSRLGAEMATSAFVFAFAVRVIGDNQVRGPLAGVFFPLVAKPKRRLAFKQLEAAFLWFCILICAAVALVTVAPAHLISFVPAAVVGLLLTAGFWPPRSEREGGQEESPLRDRPSLRGTMIVARLQWRRPIGPASAQMVAIALFVGATGAAALAHLNNADASMSVSILAAGALLVGAVLGRIDACLIRFLAHEPIPLMRVVASAALPTCLVVTLSVMVAGLIIGLPPMVGCWTAAGIGGLCMIYMSAAVLHAVTGKPRFANFAAAVELAICAALLMVYAPLLWVWAPVRIIMLTRQARRLRWTGQ